MILTLQNDSLLLTLQNDSLILTLQNDSLVLILQNIVHISRKLLLLVRIYRLRVKYLTQVQRILKDT